MTNPYVDIQTIHNPSTGGVPPASWGDQIRTNLEWLVDPPRAKGQTDTTQSISHATSVAVQYDGTDLFDTDGFHDPASNNTRFTVPTDCDGLYMCLAEVRFDANSTYSQRRQIAFKTNGGAAFAVQNIFPDSPANDQVVQVVGYTDLVATDYVECHVYQTTGVSIDITESWMAVIWQART